MAEASVHFIYDALAARTIRSLRREMLKNNARHGISFEYRDFSFVNGKWWCWYRVEVTSQDPLFQNPKRGDIRGNEV